MQIVPYLAAKMPIAMIAKLFNVGERTVVRWSEHPEVRAALGEVAQAAVLHTKATAVELADLAWQTLREVMSDSEDDRTRVDAAKTVLDRTGFPARTETTHEHSGPDGRAIPVLQVTVDAARILAREGGER